jgi:hypothetical protein
MGKSWAWWYNGRQSKIGAFWSIPAWAKNKTISKITRATRAGGVAQVVQHLLSKCEALNSNSSTAKNE